MTGLCSRRQVLVRSALGAGVVLAPGVLVACSSGSGDAAAGASSTASTASAGSDQAPSSSVPAASVPVGTAVVVQALGDQVVLAQPTAGTYVAYSAVCPHAGGIVAPLDGTVVRCPLHGSEFDTGRGAEVLQGPAAQPLSSYPLRQQGDQLVLG